MTTEKQKWIETTIGSWSRHWFLLLIVGSLFGVVIWLNHNTDRAATTAAFFLGLFLIVTITAVHCLSSEILNLRKRIEDLEKKTNS
ncbi:MAG: hypothetical protein WAO21_10755 [Verrucomicrobiia bacterium]|jgi:hypothetical protein